MILTENKEAVSGVLQAVRKSQGFNIREGIHVSDLVYCLMKGYLRKTTPVPIIEEDAVTLMWLLGRGHHGIFEIGASEVPVEAGGIVGTVDLIQLDDHGENYPVEIKTTRQSANRAIIDQTHWFQQLASYCCMLDTEDGQLWVMYLNGNYKPPTPILKVYNLHFSYSDLAAWWGEMTRRKELLTAMLSVSRAEFAEHPEELIGLIPYHHTWECSYCSFKGKECPGGEGVNEGYLIPSMGVKEVG